MTAREKVACFKESPDAWQTKFQRLVRLPFPLPWTIVAIVLFVVGYGIVIVYEPDSDAIRLLFLDALLVAGLANAVAYVERLLDGLADSFPVLLAEEESKVQEWTNYWYDNIFWSAKNVYVGIALGVVVGLSSIESIPVFFKSVPGRCCGHFFACVVGFFGGSMLWTMLGIARLMASLGRDVRIAPSIFDSKTSALRSASSVLWRVAILGAFLYVTGVSVYLLCPAGRGTSDMVVMIFFGVFIVLYFIIPQVNIHRTLLDLKRDRLNALVKQIDATFDSVARSPTPDNIGQLRDLFDLQRVINGKKAWSFGVGELLALIGTIVIPLCLFALNHYICGK